MARYEYGNPHPITVGYPNVYGGRSLRCKTELTDHPGYRHRPDGAGPCNVVLVREDGDWQKPYVHWTDPLPDGSGRTWMDVAVRHPENGRLMVPKNWRKRRKSKND